MIYPCIALLKGAILHDHAVLDYLENFEEHSATEFRGFLEREHAITFWPDRIFHNNDGAVTEDRFAMVTFYGPDSYRTIFFQGYTQRFLEFFNPQI